MKADLYRHEMELKQVLRRLSAPATLGPVPGGAEAKGAGAANSQRDHPAVGGGRH